MALKRWVFPGIIIGLVTAAAALPLSWVAPIFVPETAAKAMPDLHYDGRIWSGTVSGLPVFEVANFKIHPLKLSADLEAGDGFSYLTTNMSRREAEDVKLIVNLSRLPITDQRLQGLVGTLQVNVPNISYNAEGCTEAQGTIRTDVLQRNGGAVNWTGPELSGPITCEDRSLVSVLTGRDSEQTVEARLRFSPDGTYRVDITVRTSRSEAGAILPLFGFSPAGRGFKLTEQGKWR